MGTPEWTLVGLFFLGIIFGVIGYLLARRDDVTDKNLAGAQEEHKQLRIDVASFRDLVLGEYIRRKEVTDHFDKLEQALFNKLDRIEAKLDNKADK